MAMNFPDNPSVNDEFTVGDQTWVWTGTTWDTVPLTEYSPSPHATTHELGGSDELTLDPTQVSGLDELNTGTEGYTALSNGSSGLSYQPVSHNYIINGAFDIWQRLPSGSTSFTDPADDDFLADRWKLSYNGSGATRTISKQAITPGEVTSASIGEPEYALRFDTSVAGSGESFVNFATQLEDVRTLAGQEATISFYAKASSAITINRVRYLQRFDSASGVNPGNFETGINVGTTWQRYSFQKTIDSLDGKTVGNNSSVEIQFLLPINQTFTLDITGVQLEAGSIATPFKRNANSIAGELAACQRYYQRVSENSTWIFTGFYNSTTTMAGDYQYPVTMRRIPDFNHLGNGAVAVGSSLIGASDFDASFLRTTSALFEATTSAQTLGAAASFRINSSGDTFFELDAEL